MSLSSAEIARQIAEIDEKLASGVSSHSTDGTTTNYDLDSLRRHRDDLVDQLAGHRKKQRCTAIRMDDADTST